MICRSPRQTNRVLHPRNDDALRRPEDHGPPLVRAEREEQPRPRHRHRLQAGRRRGDDDPIQNVRLFVRAFPRTPLALLSGPTLTGCQVLIIFPL